MINKVVTVRNGWWRPYFLACKPRTGYRMCSLSSSDRKPRKSPYLKPQTHTTNQTNPPTNPTQDYHPITGLRPKPIHYTLATPEANTYYTNTHPRVRTAGTEPQAGRGLRITLKTVRQMKRKRISQVIVFAVTCMGSVCFIGNRDQCERTAKAMNGEVAPLHIVRDNHVKTRDNHVNRINVNSLTKQNGECKVFIPAIGSNTLHHDSDTKRLRAYNRWKHKRAIQYIQNEFKLYNDRHAEAVTTSTGKSMGKRKGKDDRVRRLFRKITSQDIQTLENISLITSSAT